MVYNGILMETIGIYVMVYIELLLFFASFCADTSCNVTSMLCI